MAPATSADTVQILAAVQQAEDRTLMRLAETETRMRASVDRVDIRVGKLESGVHDLSQTTGALSGFTQVLEERLATVKDSPTAGRNRAESGGLTVAIVGAIEAAKRLAGLGD